MKKVISIVCILAAALSLCACGGGSTSSAASASDPTEAVEAAEGETAGATEAVEETAESVADVEFEAAANIDPATLNPGHNTTRDTGTSDIWFCTTNEQDYFYINDANKEYYETGLSVYWYINGEEILDSAKNEITDNHLVSTEDSPLEFDLMFLDAFTAYDAVSQNWYYREGMQAVDVESLFYNQYLESEKGNSLYFHEDYTADEVWSGSEGTGTWEAVNATQIMYYPNDGSNQGYAFTYYLTDDNTLDSIDCYDMGTYYVTAQ